MVKFTPHIYVLWSWSLLFHHTVAQTSVTVLAAGGAYSFANAGWASVSGSIWITFEADCSTDIHVGLLSSSYGGRVAVPGGSAYLMYEIVMGGWGNTQSVLRYRLQTPYPGSLVLADYPCLRETYRPFWASYDNSTKVLSYGISSWRKSEIIHQLNFPECL